MKTAALPFAPDTADSTIDDRAVAKLPRTAGGIRIRFETAPPPRWDHLASAEGLRLYADLVRLSLLRGFDELLCLEGLHGVEHLPHQIETVRRVLRHFRGRVLLADEVGLGKTIEACLLLREYLLRSLAKRVLILVPAPLVSQWQEELSSKFGLDFALPPRGGDAAEADFWTSRDRVLAALSFAKQSRRAEWVAAEPWDLVIVDEAHHCKNRTTKNWQLINSLKRKHMFLLTATPVQNDLVELYNLLTLLEPGHLKTEADFKKQYVRRGNPRDPKNRERLRSLLGQVMIRNTRSLVNINLPPRYAQTVLAAPDDEERQLYEALDQFLRRCTEHRNGHTPSTIPEFAGVQPSGCLREEDGLKAGLPQEPVSRMKLGALLAARGSHPRAIASSLEDLARSDGQAADIADRAERIHTSAKDRRFLELIHQAEGRKVLTFVNLRQTLHHLEKLLRGHGVAFSTFSGEQSAAEKDAAVEGFRERVPVMLCTDSGGEGRNLQFADTLINYDLPWNPMRIEQRVGRVHRIGQTHDVFVFNLCTEGSLEARILRVLHDKIRMFELVVGEVGSILGNLEGGDEFESLVLQLWMSSRSSADLDAGFDRLGSELVAAQKEYLGAKELDEALFGEDYE